MAPILQKKEEANMMRGLKWVAFPLFFPYARMFQDKFGNCEEGEGLGNRDRCTQGCVPPDIDLHVCAGASGYACGNPVMLQRE